MANKTKKWAILRRSLFRGEESVDIEATFEYKHAAEDYLLELQNSFVNQGTARNMYWDGDTYHIEVSDEQWPEDDIIWDFKIVPVEHYNHF